jgi:hypothetical protein
MLRLLFSRLIPLFTIFLSLTIPLAPLLAASLAEWTFPNNPDDSLVDASTPENVTETLEGINLPSVTFATAGATTNAAFATGWQNGAETKAWQTRVSTLGYKTLTVSAKLRSLSTGPRDFRVQYRVGDTGAWLDVPGGAITILTKDSFDAGTLDTLPLPAAAENQERVFVRFLMSSNTSAGGGSIGSTGSNRIDDLVISGAPLSSGPVSRCSGDANTIYLNELLPYPPSNDIEYAELFNTGGQCVDLSGWYLRDAGNHTFIFPSDTFIEAGEYLPLVQNLYLNNTTSDTLSLFTQENLAISSVSYDRALQGFSYNFDGSSWRFSSQLTPGAENSFDEVDEETPAGNLTGQVFLSEIFPNPVGDEAAGEFIELFNASNETQDLRGSSLSDSSSAVFTFSNTTLLAPGAYLALPRSLFRFALNNTGEETITFFSPSGEQIDSVTYSAAPEGQSYSFTGTEWRWTKTPTPNTANTFSKTKKITLDSKKTGYKNVPLVFAAHLGKKQKDSDRYRWDFGDGHRSTLASPKHSYTKTGTYHASVTIIRGEDKSDKTFSVRITKYPKIPLLITALLPNPKGTDSGTEWIEILNQSSKTVSLDGWKIASSSKTGEQEKLLNHPITQEVSLAPGQKLRLTKEAAAFTLGNKSAALELRAPSGDTVSRTEYSETKVLEDVVCKNINGLCVFEKTAPKKETSTKKPPSAVLPPPDDAVTDTPLPEYHEPTKKELLRHIGHDVNLLTKMILRDMRP